MNITIEENDRDISTIVEIKYTDGYVYRGPDRFFRGCSVLRNGGNANCEWDSDLQVGDGIIEKADNDDGIEGLHQVTFVTSIKVLN